MVEAARLVLEEDVVRRAVGAERVLRIALAEGNLVLGDGDDLAMTREAARIPVSRLGIGGHPGALAVPVPDPQTALGHDLLGSDPASAVKDVRALGSQRLGLLQADDVGALAPEEVLVDLVGTSPHPGQRQLQTRTLLRR